MATKAVSVSVPDEGLAAWDDALQVLARGNVFKSKSSVIVEAVLAQAALVRAEDGYKAPEPRRGAKSGRLDIQPIER